MSEPTTQDVVRAIREGQFSAPEMERILAAVRHRQEDLALQLSPGDRVISNRNVRPKYLAGRYGTVQAHRGDRVLVRMDECGHYRVSGVEWRMSPGSIRKVEVDA